MADLDDFTLGQPVDAPDRTGHLVDKRAHTRLDGTPTGVLTWRVRCTHPGCPVFFEATTGLHMPRDTLRKHCDAHRLTPAEYLRQGREKRREIVKVERAAKRQARAAERERKAAEKEAARAAHVDKLVGLRKPANPLGHPRRKLSDEDVAEIHRLHAEGLSSKDLAVVFPVSDSTIRNILTGARRAG